MRLGALDWHVSGRHGEGCHASVLPESNQSPNQAGCSLSTPRRRGGDVRSQAVLAWRRSGCQTSEAQLPSGILVVTNPLIQRFGRWPLAADEAPARKSAEARGAAVRAQMMAAVTTVLVCSAGKQSSGTDTKAQTRLTYTQPIEPHAPSPFTDQSPQ